MGVPKIPFLVDGYLSTGVSSAIRYFETSYNIAEPRYQKYLAWENTMILHMVLIYIQILLEKTETK